MKIPYGTSDFETIRSRGFFYADKTPFLPLLESEESGYRQLLLLRPRRFGKSTFVSMLAHYYDIAKKEHFERLFKGLWIHEHPTAERNSYLVLTLDFSQVATGRGPEALFRTFFEAVRSSVETLLIAYRELAPELRRLEDRLGTYQDPEALMASLMGLVRASGHRLYVLIDEYDNFANQLLSGASGDPYEKAIVERTGFVRSFYATLKAGVGTGAVGRMFITGVTPLLLDDLASAFNIVTPISRSPRFNTIAGFTRADVERAVDEFLVAHPGAAMLPELSDRPRLLEVLEQHYNGYRFSEGAVERVFNSDMVLYFLRELADGGRYPSEMLDPNVRTEYRHLQRIGALSGAAADERRKVLETMLSEGHIRSELVQQFGARSLASRTPYVSLLYYLGMLTLRDAPRDSIGYDLEVPNRVIRELQWEHLALMLEDLAHLSLNVDELRVAFEAMAVEGDIGPFLELFHTRVLRTLGLKDLRGLDERTLKLLFMMYASIGRVFLPLSEKEFAQGYCDLFLGASMNVAKARFSWLIELKYLKADAGPSRIEAAFAQAEEQVARYASDDALMPLLLGDRELRAGMLVLVGTRKPLFRPWPATPGTRAPGSRRGRETKEGIRRKKAERTGEARDRVGRRAHKGK